MVGSSIAPSNNEHKYCFGAPKQHISARENLHKFTSMLDNDPSGASNKLIECIM